MRKKVLVLGSNFRGARRRHRVPFAYAIVRYGHTETVDIAVIPAIWYGAFGNTAGHLVLARDPDSTKAYDLACSPPTPTTPPSRSSNATLVATMRSP